ncbi:MAG: TatD family hydrolase, partial [Bacteroidetes bacterium]|nr:TatD family hydrolase [Bacteroidota bacterium]
PSLPLDYVVLETDSPYLAPVPYRGKRNESAYLINIAENLATIYGKGLDEIAMITTQNALNIFNL